MPLDEAAYVKSSRYRVAALRYLQSGPTNPSKIAEDEDEHISHVSRALSELLEKDLVSVHGDGSRHRIYKVTERGREVLELVDELGGGEE
jgi:DNA-binding MarR family transcriptional regulator